MRANPTTRLAATGLAVLTLLLGSGVSSASPATPRSDPDAAATPAAFDPSTLSAPAPDLHGLPTTSPELAAVPVESDEFDAESARYADVAGRQADASATRAGYDAERSDLLAGQRKQRAVATAARARARGLRSHIVVVERAITDLAARLYVAGGDEARINDAIASDQPAINDSDRRSVLAQSSMNVLLAERAAYTARYEKATKQAKTAERALRKAEDRLEDLARARPKATRAEVATGRVVAKERVSYEQARVLATVEGVEFPLVALDAYFRAARSEDDLSPTCRIQWWAVAGIARVEGHHGTYGGAALDPNGDTTKRIIGIQLNGTKATRVVGDTDGGTLDGDPAFDRAIGPMQFIPSTWRRYEADGNDDGQMSPFNMYDATLAAASYLCRARSGLAEDPGLRAAYFSYNHSVAYVDSVLRFARLYERSIDVPEPRD